MDKFTNTQLNEAKKFGEFYIDLLDNHKETLLYYLAETAVLDWFGHTVKGSENIHSFMKHNVHHHKQHFKPAQPVEQIGFRDTHIIKFPNKAPQAVEQATEASSHTNNEVTPPKRPLSVVATCVEQGQGDGPHVDVILESPVKKCKLDLREGQGDVSVNEPQIKYVSTNGHVEFRKSSSKKLQPETRWNRPCKLEMAYCGDKVEECTIYMIIYQSNMKCRKNLMKEFESCASND